MYNIFLGAFESKEHRKNILVPLYTAGVILQPVFRLHKESCQAALRVTALVNYRDARGGSI